MDVSHAGPPILVVTQDSIDNAVIDGALAPASVVPVFSLTATTLP